MLYASFSGDGGQVDQYYNYWLVKGYNVHRIFLIVIFLNFFNICFQLC